MIDLSNNSHQRSRRILKEILGMQAYQGQKSAIDLDAVLMAIPFVMVAFAELTKKKSPVTFCCTIVG